MDSRIPSQESEKQLFKILISENNQKRFQCTVCSRILSRQQTFEIHLKTVHAYNGPQLFKRKYKLYEEDSSVKIPRQTLHYRQSKQQNRILAVDVNQLSCHEAVSVQDEVYQNDAGIYFSSNQANDTESSLCNNEDSDYNIESSVCSNQDIFTLFPVYNHEVDDAQFSDNETESESDLSSSDNGLTSESSTDESDVDISDVDELSKTDDCSEVKKISMAIMSYMSRHTLTNEAAKDMIELIKVMIPENELFKTLSLSTVQEVCGHCEIKAYDICEVCLCIFPDDNQIYRCTTEGCDGLRYKGSLAQQSRRKSKNSFATVNINDQLKSLLERDGIWKTVQQRVTTRGKSTITDIVDGKYYMELCKAGQFLEDTNNISLIFNTDGAPLYSSSSVSLWPVFLAVNELPSPDRFSKQNMLMWGIWQGKGKPPFDVYFEPFATNMTELYNKGVAIVPPKYQNSICVKAAVIIGSTDLQGKAYLLDMTHHNGTNGCLTCEEPGLVVSQGKGHTRCYPYKTEPKAAKKRTGQSFLKNAFKANDRKEEVKGVFGVTSLALMEWFDIVLGMVPDYMHGCLLGVTKSLLYKWMSSKNHKKPFFVGGQISKINKRLMEMKPTDTLARLPRDLEKHFKNLKASELQAWLLYYSLPCLIGYLPDKYLLHFAHFAEGIFLLLGDAISPTNLCRARDLLNVFYRDFENLYGQGSCGLNVHNAGAHLVDYVEGWGPLWAWSTFGFEDMNGTLMDNTHGTGNVCRQLIWTLHAMSRLRFEVNLMAESKTKEFIRRMLSTKREVKNLKVANNCSVAGGVKKCQDFPEHISRAVNGLIGEGEVVKAARIVVGGHIFFSKHYSRMVKRNPCVVQFSDDSLGEIEYFAWNTASGGVVAIYRQVMINDEKPFFFNEAGHHVLRVQNERSELKVKKVEDILEKVLLLEGNPTNPCIIRFPNFNGVCG